jgi:hypothetical protein
MICKSNNFAGVYNGNAIWQNRSERVTFHADQIYEPYGGGAGLSNLVWVVATQPAKANGFMPSAAARGYRSLDGQSRQLPRHAHICRRPDRDAGRASDGGGWIDRRLAPEAEQPGRRYPTGAHRSRDGGRRLIDLLANLGVALPVLRDANGQSVAGVFTTSTHGRDWDQPPLVDCVRTIHLLTHGGRELWIERASEPGRMISSGE